LHAACHACLRGAQEPSVQANTSVHG
jgi:hypothetical protein